MKSGSYIPDRGDIVWLNFNPQAGHEQRGKRPALIISPKIYNEKTSLCLCLPITSKIKGYPFEVAISSKLPIKGVVLSDQIKNLDFTVREITFICKSDKTLIQTVQKNILALVRE
ncbi:Programmed cell death toxin MazF [hydrothermal vent metagenome]|uniref:Programmed cell death toxin MazF n=1 Tax=hydrothermal vent metagenome TaxID=652676 RepID=A0A1W1D0D2_9ZZZZ